MNISIAGRISLVGIGFLLARSLACAQLAVTLEPTNATVRAGDAVRFKVSVSGDGPFTYQWFHDNLPIPRPGIVTTVVGGSYGDGGPALVAQIYDAVAIAADRAGNLYVAEQFGGCVRKVDLSGKISTIAGNGFSADWTTDGVATNTAVTPSALAVDSQGNLYMASGFTVCKLEKNGMLHVVAGNGYLDNSIRERLASDASLNWVGSIALDKADNVFITDAVDGRIFRLDRRSILTCVAGNGTAGFSGDGGPALEAAMGTMVQIAVDADGNLIVADTQNNRVRKVGAGGMISTIAGTGVQEDSGDGGLAVNASLCQPSALAFDQGGNLLVACGSGIRQVDKNGVIATLTDQTSGPMCVDGSGSLYVCDGGNRVVKVEASGAMTTVAGDPARALSFANGGPATNAALVWPIGLATDSRGNLYVSDNCYASVRKVDTNGMVTTIAGGGSGPWQDGMMATNAQFDSLIAVTVDGEGNIWFADGWSLGIRIHKVDTNGILTLIAGTATNGFSGDGGFATNAALNAPQSLTVDSAGNLFIVDGQDRCIRKVDSRGVITTVAGGGTNAAAEGVSALDASLSWPTGVLVDSDGSMVFGDLDRICKVDQNGVISTLAFSNPWSGFDGVSALTMDSFGRMFLADWWGRIYRLGSNGDVSRVMGGAGPATWEGEVGASDVVFGPVGSFAVSPTGDIFVAAQFDSRIRKVTFSDSPLLLKPVAIQDAGDYQVVVSNSWGSVTSSVASLTVLSPPIVGGLVSDSRTSLGRMAGFSAQANGTAPLAYQWTLNGAILPGATNASYAINSVQKGDLGCYALVITNAYGCVTSTPSWLNLFGSSIFLPEIDTQTRFFGFYVVGDERGNPAVLESCTNLAAGRWTSVMTNSSVLPVQFHDVSAVRERYYRVRSAPHP